MHAQRLIFCSLSAIFLFLGCVWNSGAEGSYLPLDDSEYPYAGIPRLVVETQNFKDIRNVDEYVTASMQIYGAVEPISEIQGLKIRGRGNSSFTSSKFGYRLELDQKQTLLGMAADKDWVLVPNFTDKSLLRNSITHMLAQRMDCGWLPKSEFVEVYVNRDYKGVYLLMEKIEVSKNRVDLGDYSVLAEVDHKYREGEQLVFSEDSTPFRIHFPKKASRSLLEEFEKYINNFTEFLSENFTTESLQKWIDIDNFIQYYWIQELSKNPDGGFNTSVYFSWGKDLPILMGPLWDFDMAYGALYNRSAKGWFIRLKYWNENLFKNAEFKKMVDSVWLSNRERWMSVVDSIPFYGNRLRPAAENNFRRWPILKSSEILGYPTSSFSSYEEAVESFQNWIYERMEWIDSQI